MRAETAILDGYDSLRNVGRHLRKAERFSAAHPAVGDQMPVDRDDLDIGGPLREFPCRRRRHLGTVIDNDACRSNSAPNGQNETPVDEPSKKTEKPAPPPGLAANGLLPRCGLAPVLLLAAGGHYTVLFAHRKGRRIARRLVESRFDASVPAARHALPSSSPCRWRPVER